MGHTTEGPALKLEITDWLAAPIDLPEGAQEFAVGDVHGHVVALGVVLDAMRSVAGTGARLTLLGDLIDRGPASLPALRLGAEGAAALGVAGRTTLLGNHEILMMMALAPEAEAPDALDLWLANGGDSTVAEAGVSPSALALGAEQARAGFRLAAGERAFAMLEQAPLARRVGNLVFVHAGIDPRVPLDRFLAAPRLSITDRLHPAWIREEFLHHEGPFEGGRIVVHGHTPEARVLRMKGRAEGAGFHRLDGSRLGLDGGSYMTGIVAGAEFRRGAYRVFVARGAAP
jgi:serine/threonine protein phosphatase 1